MQPLEAAILRTIIYADIFQFPLTEAELHRYIIHHNPVSPEAIRTTLTQSSQLAAYLYQSDGYIALAEHRDFITLRKEREQYTQLNWQRAQRYGRWLARIPFVRMVALTGALAVRNPSSPKDDYDYFLVTQPGRVWMARLFAILLVRLVRLWGDELCPNYVLSADKLQQSRCDLFIAHEIAQMHPIFGQQWYQKMFEANAWTSIFLPNAASAKMTHDFLPRGKQFLEHLLSTRPGDWLEQWEYRRKIRRFTPQSSQPEADAIINRSHVKGHFDDHGLRVMQQYTARLREYGLAEIDFVSHRGDEMKERA